MRAAATISVALLLLCHTRSASAGSWTQPQGSVWFKSAFLYHLSAEQFAPTAAVLEDGTPVERGDRRPFNDDGSMRVRVLWSEAEYGLHERVTLGVQLPYYDLRFEDRFQRTDSWGIGDIRFTGRIALLDGAHRLSARGAWKLPAGKAATDPDDVPLSEGQHDLEAGLQYGHSLGRDLSWVGIEGGYRWRRHDEETGRDPGNEWLWNVELGHALSGSLPLALRVAWSGLRGDETRDENLGIVPGQRRFHDLGAGLIYRWTAWIFETGLTHTVSGEAFPAGTSWNVGISRAFQLRG
ncbi:MAG TPA: transporter [Candidatus Krumholzibacteria bacterium]